MKILFVTHFVLQDLIGLNIDGTTNAHGRGVLGISDLFLSNRIHSESFSFLFIIICECLCVCTTDRAPEKDCRL